MPRQRTLKPEFFKDRRMAVAGPITALVYQALWCSADDSGVARADPDLVYGEWFTRWPAFTVTEVIQALTALSESSRITLLRLGDDLYARINQWTKHQQINRPSAFRYLNGKQAVLELSLDEAHGALREGSRSTTTPTTSTITTTTTPPTPPTGRTAVVKAESWETVAERIRTRIATHNGDLEAAGKLVLSYFNAGMQTNYRWGGKVKEKITARLRQCRDVSALFYTVDGALRDDTIMGRRPDSPEGGYRRPSTVFRDDEQVERLMTLIKHRESLHPTLAEMLQSQDEAKAK